MKTQEVSHECSDSEATTRIRTQGSSCPRQCEGFHARDHRGWTSGTLYGIERDVELHGDLTAEQRAQLPEMANRCPVHKTLTSEIDIRTRLV